MRIRTYTEADLSAVKRMHEPFAAHYDLPDFGHPLFIENLVVENGAYRAVPLELRCHDHSISGSARHLYGEHIESLRNDSGQESPLELMKIKLLFFSLVLLATGGSLFAQSPAPSSTGSITTNAANCNTTNACIVLHMAASNVGYSVSVSGTWTGTLTVEQSGDNQATWSTATTTTANTLYTSALLPGITDARVRSSAAMTGTAVVTITASGPATIQNNIGGSGSGSTPGVFTNAQMNQPFTDTLTGGSSCNAALILNSGLTVKITDAFAACANTPASAVTNGWTSALAGYVRVNDPNQGGQFGKVQGVGIFSGCLASANNTKCLGSAPQVSSGSGLSGVVLTGTEIGVVPFNTTDIGQGILLSFEGGPTQPAGDNMPAIVIQTPSGAGTFTSGLEVLDGSVSSTFGLILGKAATGNGQNSTSIKFNATNSSGTNFSAFWNLNQDNVLFATTPRVAVSNASGEESYGVLLTSTAALVQGSLVKVDTANPNAVVICTTADTQCDGFVQGTNTAGNGLCLIGSTVCPINMTPGSKAVGILGTGTCTIGQFVVVDTTTNGRVKCQAGIPAQGAYIGKALSAQASVGSSVNILTKFQ